MAGSYIGVVGGRITTFGSYEDYTASGARQPTTTELSNYAQQQQAAGAIRCASFNGTDLLNAQDVYNRTVAERGETVIATVRGYHISAGNAAPGSLGANENIINQMAGLGLARRSNGSDSSDTGNVRNPETGLYSRPSASNTRYSEDI